MRNYTPIDWYWLASDDRVYSSARGQIVPSSDAAYKARESEGAVTPWPKDAEGNQTQDALDEVLRPFGIGVPFSVTPLQMRKALRLSGLKAAADAFVGTMSEEAQEEWEYATAIDRDHPFIVAATVAMGKTEAELDALFALAASL